MIKRGKIHNPPQVGDATCMYNRRPYVVDKLLFDQVLAVPNCVEYFADSQRRRRMFADQAKALLK